MTTSEDPQKASPQMFLPDPYDYYRAMRESSPIHQTSSGVWILFRYRDVRNVWQRLQLSVENKSKSESSLRDRRGSQAMLNCDPPDHGRLRHAVGSVLSRERIEQLRVASYVTAQNLIQPRRGGGLDLISEFSSPLAFSSISDLLGVGQELSKELRRWTELVVPTVDRWWAEILHDEPITTNSAGMHDLDFPKIGDAANNMRTSLTDLLNYKRAHPADDALSELIEFVDRGSLSLNELVEQVILLYMAGHEPTSNLIGNGVLALLRHPEQLDRLRRSPRLMDATVKELLRYDSPIQMSRRYAVNDFIYEGNPIAAGSFLAFAIGSANRDHHHWGETADAVDISRPGTSQHLAFGCDMHRCLGEKIAQLIMASALTAIIECTSRIALSGTPVQNCKLNPRGLDFLPVSVK